MLQLMIMMTMTFIKASCLIAQVQCLTNWDTYLAENDACWTV